MPKSDDVDHGGAWPAKIVSAKYHAVEACWRIVDKAMEISGGPGMFRGSELERVFRDARCGRFHPANTFLVHEIVGKTALGIDKRHAAFLSRLDLLSNTKGAW